MARALAILLCTLLLCAAATATIATGKTAKYAVHRVNDGSFEMRPCDGECSFQNNSVVTGSYSKSLMSIGWDEMTIVTNPAFHDLDQAAGAGYFEGQVTYSLFLDFLNNTVPKTDAKVEEFLQKMFNWARTTAKTSAKNDPFWAHVALITAQFDGILAGMNAAAKVNKGPNVTEMDLLRAASYGDLFDLNPAVNPSKRADWRKMSKDEFDAWFVRNTHCSSLFKITGNFEDIFFGHATWNEFNSMNRIFKHITFNFNSVPIAAKTISMSSYPGLLSSLDDFYVMSSGMVAIETSLSVLNTTMYDGNVVTDSLLYWIRVMVANRLATDSPQWSKYFSMHNSGTYNNQWMVLNTNLFTPGKDLPANTFWVVEQMPGVVAAEDMTKLFRYGYYPSYNVPMNEELFIKAGYAEAVEKQGPEMNDYEMCVRAQIFRRDQGTVKDLESYKHIMQYNDWEKDPISKGNPLYAIASRADLNPHLPGCFGAIDAKVSSVMKLRTTGFSVDAYSGPTPQQPNFDFATTKASCGPHAGMPTRYAFDWQTMTPSKK